MKPCTKLCGLCIGVLVVGALMIGCATSQAIPYSFVKESGDSASVLFYQGNPGVSLVYFEDDMLPNPEEKTYWNPIAFPADTAFTMMVHAYYAQSNNYNPSLIGSLVTTTITASRSVDTDVLFNCPPLGAGKNYKLVFRKGSGVSGKNILVLIDSETNKIVYRQEFSAK